MKKNNVPKVENESPEEYFVGMLLTASENNINRIEFADVWNKRKNKTDVYYRTSGFNEKWDFKKAKRIPFRFYDIYDTFIKKVKDIMKKKGMSVPVTDIKCIDIEDGRIL